MLFNGSVEDGALDEMLRADLKAGAGGQAVALVAETASGQVVGFVNTSPHDDFDGDDGHLDVDTLEIGFLLTTPHQPDTRPQLLGKLIPAITVREFERVYRRVQSPEQRVFETPEWWMLPLNYGIAWKDVDDASSVFIQLPDVGEQIAVHETGAGDNSWAFPIPDDLDELSSIIVEGREYARHRGQNDDLPRA
ncbi:hypothetical protein SAMN04489834_2199 [Microterricola viridarii]|uniref:Uncharacterized protein n=2 Tax=Microterricola viridarii TaxID=412690 RepID=A0A1H1V915_9MICO|nr:hypothetical protein SAMN04489834_2199 [Microterricola viridarii]